MLKQKTNHKKKLKLFTFNLEVRLYCDNKRIKLKHKFLQVFIFIKQSAIEKTRSRDKLKYNTNCSKRLKKNRINILQLQ